MALFRTSHLTRRQGIYYFRMAVPGDLIARIGLLEFKCSLRTEERASARVLATRFSSDLLQLISLVRRMPSLKEEKIRELVRGYFRDSLDFHLDQVECLKKSDEDLHAEATSAFEIADAYKKHFTAGYFPSWVQKDATKVLRTNGFEDVDKGSETFNAICSGVLRAARDVLKITGHMLSGEPEAAISKDPLFSDIPIPLSVPITIEGEASHGISVGDAYRKYFAHKSKNIWAIKTIPDQKRTMEWFLSVVGDTSPARSIDKQTIKKFRDILLRLPPNFSKFAALKKLSLAELAASNNDKTLTAKTADKYLGFVLSFFKWCESEGCISNNPSAGVKIELKENAKDARFPFTDQQLKVIFSSPQYTGHRSESWRHKPGKLLVKDSLYWAPLIGLFTGMRLGEIGQLLLSDIKFEKGVHFIDVNIGEEEDKALKTKSAKRRIPIHPMLVTLGFLEHVAAKKTAASSGRLFPEVKKASDGSYSQNLSKKLNRYFARIGAKTPKTAFHSFRHNFADAAREAALPESYSRELMGHSDGSVHGIYGGSGLPLKSLAEHLAKIEYSVDLSHLQSPGAAATK